MKAFTLACLAAWAITGPQLALADGIVIKPHEDGWRPAMENVQQAVIARAGGAQRLIVAVEIDNPDASSMVWLLPVPAPAKQVHVDVLERFPRVIGTEVYGGAIAILENMLIAAVVMEVWPPLIGAGAMLIFSIFRDSDERMAPKAAAKMAEKGGEEIVVHERVAKQGMVSEVITAREGAALYAYLAGKGLALKPGAVPTLDFYTGKDYTFVASWVDGAAVPKDAGSVMNRAIDIHFPSEELFFPLYPTSAYGERVVPVSLRVAGHVTPRIFADIAGETKVGYHVARHGASEGARTLGTDLYTKIDIGSPARAFTQDLWISTKEPQQRGLGFATLLVRHPLAAGIALLALCSALVSLAVGWMQYGELRTRTGALRLLLIGLANCLSFLAMIWAATKLPAGWKRRFSFLFLFSLLFMLAVWVLTWQAEAMLEPMKPAQRESGTRHGVPHQPPAGVEK